MWVFLALRILDFAKLRFPPLISGKSRAPFRQSLRKGIIIALSILETEVTGFLTMKKHSHRFVEEYTGLVGLGLDRKTDEFTITYYIQKFADDDLMKILRSRMSDSDIEALANILFRIMKTYLTEEEYHIYFLKDQED